LKLTKPKILYSVNTWLAYNVTRLFYGDLHYVWCSPVFDRRGRPHAYATPPPTSCPCDIYFGLLDEVRGRDKHSAKIAENRLGILKGAATKRTAGIITDDELAEINAIVSEASVEDFRPLLYVIPYAAAAALVKEIPVAQRAHPLSEEYIIEALPGDLFDVIQMEKV
jgi:hypothetical protein